MKHTLIIILISVFSSLFTISFSQNMDSLALEKRLKKLEYEIKNISNEVKKNTNANTNVIKNQELQAKQLSEIIQDISNYYSIADSLSKDYKKISEQLLQNNAELKKNVKGILLIVSVLSSIIILLITYLYYRQNKVLRNILHKTLNIEGQSIDILGKTNDLKKIKKSIKSLLTSRISIKKKGKK